jgi:hypothetical protein
MQMTGADVPTIDNKREDSQHILKTVIKNASRNDEGSKLGGGMSSGRGKSQPYTTVDSTPMNQDLKETGLLEVPTDPKRESYRGDLENSNNS